VVLPVPGGPHRISDGSSPSASARSSILPSPSRCVCPTNSASDRGRIRSASGAFAPPPLRYPNRSTPANLTPRQTDLLVRARQRRELGGGQQREAEHVL